MGNEMLVLVYVMIENNQLIYWIYTKNVKLNVNN